MRIDLTPKTDLNIVMVCWESREIAAKIRAPFQFQPPPTLIFVFNKIPFKEIIVK